MSDSVFKKFNEEPKQSKEKEKNAADKLMNEEWKSQQDYKRMIVQLQLQNQKYRNELYELGETVNKILDKTKLPQSNKASSAPNLEGQLQLVKKELHNVNQFIEIYQRELNQLGNKKRQEQLDSITSTQQILKTKQQELTILKKQVRQLTHKNKGLEYKLLQYNRKNRAKSLDQQSLQLKQLINQNKNLKTKLEDLSHLQQKKEQWLKNNIQSAKNLQQKIVEQQTKFPKIKSRAGSREKSASSLPKLQSQKKIYSKWLQSNKGKGNEKLQKQLEDLEKINRMVQQKIQTTTKQIRQIQENIHKLRQKVQANQQDILNQVIQEPRLNRKDIGCQVTKRVRKTRRDWVGKFDSLRFSDSRVARQQSRLYRVLCNSAGYYQFSYYAVKDPKRVYVSKLPFDNSLITYGKESTFTVEYPDFIKNIRVKINLKTQKINQMILTSNIGLKGQFSTEPPPNPKDKNQKPQNNQHDIYYDIDVRSNEAISKLFGSYGVKFDQKKNLVGVWLQGIGAEVIEDFVQQLI